MRLILLVPLLTQVVVMVGLAGWLAYRNGYRAVEHLAYQLLDDTSERFHSRLGTYTAIPPAVTQQNADALELGHLDPADLKSWAPYLARQSDRFPHVTYLYYGSSEGRYVELHKLPDGQRKLGVSADSDETRLDIYAMETDGTVGPLLETTAYEYNPRERPWYRAATEATEPIWTNTYQFAGDPPELGISFVRPLVDPDETLIGVFGADFTVVALEQLLQALKFTTDSEALLVQPGGTIIATSESTMRRENTLGELAVAQLLTQLGPLEQVQTDRRIQFEVDDENYWAQVTPFTDDYGLQWFGVSVLPEADVTAEIDKNNRNTVLLCLLALVISTLLSSLLAQRLNRPILRLGLASQALAQGGAPQPIYGSPIQEVDLLVQSFNQMASDLAQSRSQLEAYSHQLETLVEQRTQALRQSEEKFAAAFQASPNGIAITALETGEFIEVNQRFAELIGRPQAEIL
ncbi:MAG: cache domain-containing protein, partial [Cyanobacteria bacterium P01_A01_bin.135]